MKRYITLLPFFLLVLIPKKINIRYIDCRSQFGPCNKIIESQLQRLNRKEINRFLASNPFIKKYKTRFLLPDRLVVEIVEAKPILGLKMPDGSYKLYDSDIKYLYTANETVLPVLEITGEQIEIGNALSIFKIVNFVYGLTYGKIGSERLDFDNVNGNYRVIFPTNSKKSPEVLVGGLILIIRQLNDESNNSRIAKDRVFTEIDLRFESPVLR